MAVGRREELEGDDARMARISGALARYPGGQVPGGAVIVHGECDIIEVDANVPTMAGPPGIENGGEQGQRRHQAPGVIGEREPTLHRRPARIPGERGPTGFRLNQGIVARLVVALTVTSVGRQ